MARKAIFFRAVGYSAAATASGLALLGGCARAEASDDRPSWDALCRATKYAPKHANRMAPYVSGRSDSMSEMTERISAQQTTTEVRKGRISQFHTNQYKSNRRMEDRFAAQTQLRRLDGALFGVFDGHTGSAAAQFCQVKRRAKWLARNVVLTATGCV